jgi:hypothetical protein
MCLVCMPVLQPLLQSRGGDRGVEVHATRRLNLQLAAAYLSPEQLAVPGRGRCTGRLCCMCTRDSDEMASSDPS